MKISNIKITFILIVLIVLLGFVKCTNFTNKKIPYDKFTINLSKVLKYKNSSIGDNTAVLNIINNLPANTHNTGIELQTEYKPYSLNLNYNSFEDILIRFKNGSFLLSSLNDVMRKNAIIIFALINNLDQINMYISNGIKIIYKRDELLKDYNSKLDEIIENEDSLEKFIKIN